MSDIIKFHPSYLENAPLYQRHRHFKDNDRHAIASPRYIVKSEIEEKEGEVGMGYYRKRLALLDIDNDIKAILDIHYADLTKDEFAVSGMDSERAKLISEDVDSHGTSLWTFGKQILWQQLWAGFVPIETFAPAAVADNERDALANNERSYSRIYEPDDVVDWEYFAADGPLKGELARVVFLHGTVTDGDKVYQRFKRYTLADGAYQVEILRSTQTLAELSGAKEAAVVPDKELGGLRLGELPFIPVTFIGDPVEGIKDTVIYGPVDQTVILLNKQSFYDRSTRYQGYDRHILAASGLGAQDAINLSDVTVGTIDDPSAQVHTLTASDPIASWRDIQRLRQSIKHKGLLQSNQALNPESRESPSADSKQMDNEARKHFYNELTDEAQEGIERMLGEVHAGFEAGAIGADLAVTFKRDFTMRDPEQELLEEQELRSLAGRLGEAGFEIIKQQAINRIMRWRPAPHSGMDEQKIREELIKKVLAEKSLGLTSDLAAAAGRREMAFGRGAPPAPPQQQQG